VIEPQRRNVGGLDFELTPLSGWKALETWTRVARLLAPGLDGLAALKATGQEEVLAGLAKAVQGLAATEPTELRALSQVLLESCIVTWEGKQVRLLPVFDVVMQARMLTVFKLLAWSVEVNYWDFFDAARSALGGLRAKVSASLSPMPAPTSGPATA
jgi:hypothetical protein